MNSKKLAQVLLKPFKDKFLGGKGGYVTVSYIELNELETNIELFLLRKFEEGRHVGRDHDSLVETADGEFKYEKK